MQAVRLWIRGEVRSRWGALAGVALLLAIAGGTVIAAAAAARRTDSAYPRFLAAQNAADATILDDGGIGLDLDLDAIVALPQVASYARASLITYVEHDHAALASVDDRLGRSINTAKIIEGRMYDSTRADEIVVGFGVARDLGLRVGSTLPLLDLDDEEVVRRGLRQTTLRVVGIVAGPGEFPPQYTGLYPSVHFTPAWFVRYGNDLSSGDGRRDRGSLFIRLKRGEADLPAFRAAVERLFPGQAVDVISGSELGAATRRSFHFQALGLWVLAAFGALAALLIGGQAVARQSFLGSIDFPTLGALGVGRGQLIAVGLIRAGVIGAVAALGAVVVAVALSPLAPFGDARIAEPHPGFAFDARAIVVGAGALVLTTLALALIPAWRAARLGRRALTDERESAGVSRVVALLSRVSASPAGVTGTRMAFETGRGRSAVPVRSTIAGAMFGLCVLVAATAFGASLDHLLHSPALYGARWDAFLTNYGDSGGAGDLADNAQGLLAAPGLTDITIAADLPLLIEGKPLLSFGVRKLRGNAGPPIVAGKHPRTETEIALTATTARRVGADIGDRISARVAAAESQPFTLTVVGRTVIPPFGFVNAEPGEGALLTLDGAKRLIPPEFLADITLASDAMVRFEAGADRANVIASVAPLFGRSPTDFAEGPRDTPADVVSFGRVQGLPLMLGVILGIVAAAALTHTTISSVRRRRRDLAILKTLGFERRQLRATVAWQATALTLSAAVLGVPAGIALGRWAWRMLAEQISVVPQPIVPVALVAGIAALAVVLANAIAAFPGRAAARVQPAGVLRAE